MKLASVGAILRVLNDADVRYLVVGGLAVAAHGYGRATFDVDLVIQLQSENVLRAMSALESLGYRPLVPVSGRDFADPALRQTWIRDKGMIVFQLHSDQHRETRIDVFILEPFDFDAEYDRALVGSLLPGLRVRFVRIDTLIRMKEGTGRLKDQDDAEQLKRLRRIASDGK